MFKKVLQLARVLSLDVVLGAVISSLFVAKYMHVHLPGLILLALAVSVWIIYTADHLSDAYVIPHDAHTYRHLFHQKYFKPLTILIVLISILGLLILSQLPFTLILWGGVVIALVGLYFISIQWLKLQSVFHKEFAIAILYCVGVFLAPIYFSSFPLKLSVCILFFQYLLLALSNLLLFSWYEKELDQLDQHISFVTMVGDKVSIKIINVCIGLLYSITAFAALYYHENLHFIYTQLIIVCMIISLHAILLFPAFFRKYNMYRSLADGIFLYPIIYLLI